jgi:hypothetical protein
METIIIHTEGSKLKLLKQLLKELGIAFESGKSAKSPYDQEFVQKIKERSSNAENGEYVVVTDEYKKELFGE